MRASKIAEIGATVYGGVELQGTCPDCKVKVENDWRSGNPTRDIITCPHCLAILIPCLVPEEDLPDEEISMSS